jgi:predicted RNase H-like nuclease (RuvC/YqgF family)
MGKAKWFVICFIIGMIVGAVGYWFFDDDLETFIDQERTEIAEMSAEIEAREVVGRIKDEMANDKINEIENEIKTLEQSYPDVSEEKSVIDGLKLIINLEREKYGILEGKYSRLKENYALLKKDYDVMVQKWEVLADKKVRVKRFTWGVGLLGGKSLVGPGWTLCAGVFAGINFRR